MKKISRLLACAVLCFASLLCTTACGVEIEDARVKSGTLETTVVKGEELDTSNVVVVVNYSDDTTAEITASELSFSTVDTSVVTDNAKLTITFDNYSFDVNIKVVASEYDVNEIAMFEWTSQGLYKSHIANGQTTFKNPTYNSANAEHEGKADKYLGIEPRYVGYDNPFVLDINAGGYDAMGEEVDNLANVGTNVKVELIGENNTYTELTGTNLATYVTVDTTSGASFQFTSTAKDKAFRVTVEPRNKSEVSASVLAVQAELHVIEGYNVHNAKELSIYDNSGRDYDGDGVADWNAIKTEAGTLNKTATKNIILQNDINITDSDVPTTMFWSENKDISFNHRDPGINGEGTTKSLFAGAEDNTNLELEGSFIDRDNTGVYHHEFSDGETLNLIGNYFTVSCNELTRCVVESRGLDGIGINVEKNNDGNVSYMTTHSTLFCNYYDEDRVMNNPTTVNWSNVSFTGNGSESANPKYSGAIILFKSYRVNADIYNCSSNNFGINYLFWGGEKDCDVDGNFVIDQCNGKNSYQCLIFCNGAEQVLISNSDFEGACGPAIITTLNGFDDKKEGSDDYHVTNLDMVASNIVSMVTGSEPWFKTYGADTQLGLIHTLEELLDGRKIDELAGTSMNLSTDKTIYKGVRDGNVIVNHMNFIVLAMPDELDFSNPSSVTTEGYTRKFDTVAEYKAFYADANEDDVIDGEANYGMVMDSMFGQMAIGNGSAGGVVIEDDTYLAMDGSYGQTETSNEYPNMFTAGTVMNGKIGAAMQAFQQLASMNPTDNPTAYQQAYTQFVSLYTTAFANSEYFNVYLFNGMGLMMEIFNK